MSGGKNKQASGYTIIEVMIVLAASSVMFLIASQFISGKQARTAFTQGVNEFASRLQTTINDVADGKYSDTRINCSASGGGNLTLSSGNIGDSQGNHSQCVFLGKLYYFYTSGSTLPENYEVFSLAGARVDTSNKPITDLAASRLTPVDKDAGPSFPDLTAQEVVPQHLDVNTIVRRVRLSGGAQNDTTNYSVGFVQSLGRLNSSDTSGNTYASGTQTVRLVYATQLNTPNLGPNNSPPNKAAKLIDDSTVDYAQSVSICLTDGTRYALVTVGNPNSPNQVVEQPAVTVEMRGSVVC